VFSLDPLQNPDLLKPQTYSVKNTLSAQLATLVFSLLIGAGSLYCLVLGFDKLEFVGDDEINFGVLSVLPFMAYISSVLVAVSLQFSKSVAAPKVRQSWKYHAIWIGLFSGFLVLYYFFQGNWLSAMLSVVYHLIQTVMLSLIVTMVQSSALNYWLFDEAKHRWLMSVEAGSWACKAGILPYRVRIGAAWTIGGSFVLMLFFSAGMVFALSTRQQYEMVEQILIGLIFIALIGFFAQNSILGIQILKLKDFHTGNGIMTKSTSAWFYKRAVTYKVKCHGQIYEAEYDLWKHLQEGGHYFFWYIVVNGTRTMIAFEKILNLVDAEVSTPLEGEKARSSKFSKKNARVADQKNHSLQYKPFKRRKPKRSKLPESH